MSSELVKYERVVSVRRLPRKPPASEAVLAARRMSEAMRDVQRATAKLTKVIQP